MIKTNKIIMFNAPPRAGKDTLCKALKTKLKACNIAVKHASFAKQLKLSTHAAFGIYGVPFNFFEKLKDTPLAEFHGLTPRQAYINHSEKYIKPLYGKDFFGKLLVKELTGWKARQLDKKSVILISDSGFKEEAQPLKKAFTDDEINLVHLRRDSTSFNIDSRAYWYDSDIKLFDVYNKENEIEKTVDLIFDDIICK
jgi:hypothetical protein